MEKQQYICASCGEKSDSPRIHCSAPMEHACPHGMAPSKCPTCSVMGRHEHSHEHHGHSHKHDHGGHTH